MINKLWEALDWIMNALLHFFLLGGAVWFGCCMVAEWARMAV